MEIEKKTLEEWRRLRLLTQTELAEKSGIAQAVISRIEGGKQKPGIKTARKLAEALAIDPVQVTDFAPLFLPKIAPASSHLAVAGF